MGCSESKAPSSAQDVTFPAPSDGHYPVIEPYTAAAAAPAPWIEPYTGKGCCNVGFVGRSGIGKSTFLNGFLGIKVAKTGDQETTTVPSNYRLDLTSKRKATCIQRFLSRLPEVNRVCATGRLPKVSFWDLPGAGTTAHPAATYIRDKCLRYFDFVILLVDDRVMETDVKIIQRMKQVKIKHVIVRTKGDMVLQNYWLEKRVELGVKLLTRTEKMKFGREKVAELKSDLASRLGVNESDVFVCAPNDKIDPTEDTNASIKKALLEMQQATNRVILDIMEDRYGLQFRHLFQADAEEVGGQDEHKEQVESECCFACLRSLTAFGLQQRACKNFESHNTMPLLASVVQTLNEKHVRGLFNSTAKCYRSTRAEICPKDQMLRLCSEYFNVVETRRKKGNTFNPANHSDPMKVALLEVLRDRFITSALIDTAEKANIILVWHAPSSPEVADDIVNGGFAPLSTTDPGYFGDGRYCTFEADYAAMYASDYPAPKPATDGEWVVLLCAAVVGVCYPVTPCSADFPGHALPATDPKACRFFGAPIKSPYDTHIVGVTGPSFLAAGAPNVEFHELVFREDAQLCPLAKVWFTKKS